MPTIDGLKNFKGEVYHTGQWPHESVNFTNKSVVVVGTGSTGIQAIPEIAKQAKSVMFSNELQILACPRAIGHSPKIFIPNL